MSQHARPASLFMRPACCEPSAQTLVGLQVRDLYWTFRNFNQRVRDFLRYRRITGTLPACLAAFWVEAVVCA